ncbi:PilZ domain-containing protein [Bradyrhizobium sp. 190]|uniref:PilZ domain-containing protein n=1 Tax=Bradyrhizobium sp. 190 TaxID=2782658 RepID=UPI0035AB9503
MKGTIEFGGQVAACVIRNHSETGAALELSGRIELPAQFTLLVTSDRIKCIAIWRTGKMIGVKFLL